MFDTISDYPLFGHRYTVMEFQWKKGPSRKLSGFGYVPGARGCHLAPEFPGARCLVQGFSKSGQVGYPWKGLSKCSSEMLISGR